MTDLSATDRAIVRSTVEHLRPDQVPAIRAIHEEHLVKLHARVDAGRRSIAMRELALELLAGIEQER